jgi:hypothetical protein
MAVRPKSAKFGALCREAATLRPERIVLSLRLYLGAYKDHATPSLNTYMYIPPMPSDSEIGGSTANSVWSLPGSCAIWFEDIK